MSSPSAPGVPYPTPESGTAPVAEEPLGRRVIDGLMPYLVDLWIVTVWFAVAGVIGAFLWAQLTPLPAYTRTATNGTLDEQQIAKQIATDGWFFAIAGIGGLLSGGILSLWRRFAPELIVVLVAGAGALATWLMVTIGLALGPADPTKVLPTIAVGDKAELQLKLTAHGLYFVWSVAALIGALLVLWVGEFQASRRRHAAAVKEHRGQAGPVDHLPVESTPNG